MVDLMKISSSSEAILPIRFQPMAEKRKHTVKALKKRVSSGEYQVDPKAVADAIIRRRAHLALTEAAQNECSNPESARPESTNTASGGPVRTAPMKVIGSVVARVLSRLAFALSGMQKQIS